VAEKSGVERTRNRYLRDFMLIAAPISCHAKSAYVSQGLWRGLCALGYASPLPMAQQDLDCLLC
jgi:hypothetical protein